MWGLAKSYQEGWNAASAGCLPSQNPYPDFAGHAYNPLFDMLEVFAQDFRNTTWNLWMNGWYDWSQSKYNCEAKRLYWGYRRTSDLSIAEIGAICTSEQLDGELIGRRTYTYKDGSHLIVMPNAVEVHAKDGELFLRLTLNS